MDILKPLIALLAIVNPIGVLPFFIHFTEGFSREQRRRTIRVAAISAFCVIAVSAVAGLRIIEFFGISLASFQVAGGVLLILAFAAVIRWGMRVSSNARTRFGQLAAAGLSGTIFFYVSINLLMVMGLAPVVGVPLPLVSFGGSAVMTVMLCLGLLMGLERQQRTRSSLE